MNPMVPMSSRVHGWVCLLWAVVQMFLRAYFRYMWDFDTPRTAENRKLLYVILEGEHNESAVLQVDDTGCPGLSSAIPGVTDDAMAFVHHADATTFLRDQMSNFFVSNTPMNDTPTFLQTMRSVGDVQLIATLSRLAGGLPMYKVTLPAPP